MTAGLCYMVNIRGDGIPISRSDACDLEVGVFAGSAGPGDSLELEVPSGKARRLDVYGYLRSSSETSCPALKSGFERLDRARLFKLAEVASFDALSSTVELAVSFAAPSATNQVGAVLGLPGRCSASASGGAAAAAAYAASSTLTGGIYTVTGRAGAAAEPVTLHSPNYTVQGHLVGGPQ